MKTIYECLIELTAFDPATLTGDQLVLELMRTVEALSDDDWNALPEAARTWYNDMATSANSGGVLSMPPGYKDMRPAEEPAEEPKRRGRRAARKEEPAEESAEEPAEESAEEPKRRGRRAAKKEEPAEEAVQVDDLGEGQEVILHLSDGTEVAGTVLEISRRYAVLVSEDDEELEIPKRSIESVALAETTEDSPELAQKSSRPAASEEPKRRGRRAARKEEPAEEPAEESAEEPAEESAEEPKRRGRRAAKKEEPAEEPKSVGRPAGSSKKKTAGYLAKVILIEDGSLSNAAVIELLAAQGKKYSEASLNVIRSELEMTLEILGDLGKLAE